MPRLRLIGVLTCLIAGSSLRAELILDGFDDAVSVVSPSMVNEFVDTTNVGDLGARRSVRIAGLGGTPVGRVDINAGDSSAYVCAISALNGPFNSLGAYVALQVDYSFATSSDLDATMDVTDGGRNTAILLDFNYLLSTPTPTFFRVILADDRTRYESFSFSVPLFNSPRTLMFSFDSFQLRGGGVGLPNFSKIQSLDFELRLVSGQSPAALNTAISIDRIFFGAVPEPATRQTSLIGVLALIFIRRVTTRNNQAEGSENENRMYQPLSILCVRSFPSRI